MEVLKTKLSSRKLWAAIAGFITGISMLIGLDQTVVNVVAGATVAAGSLLSYIIVEGKIDAARLATTIELVGDAIETVTEK